MDVPVGAQVECADGLCGLATCVVIQPTSNQVTHVGVKVRQFRDGERLVPNDQIVESTPDLIRLHCSKDQLAAMEPVTETQYIQGERPDYQGMPYRVWTCPMPETKEWQL